MNFSRIKGLLLQEIFITLHSYEVIIDIIISPILTTILFGFLTIYLTGNGNKEVSDSILSGTILWNIVFIMQYSVSVGSLWNVWSRNLSNMFTTPITISEYIFTYFLSGFFKSLGICFMLSLITNFVFKFNIFSIGAVPLIVYIFNLGFFALSLGMILLGLVFRFGTRIQAFSWGVLPVFQVISATFYPVRVLPEGIQLISKGIPSTYIFESMRVSLQNPGTVVWQFIGMSLVLNCMYFIISCTAFKMMIAQSKMSGQFSRLDG